jgi:hypothetical protein
MAVLRFRRTPYKAGGTAAADRVSYITRQPVHALSRAEQQLRYIAEGREDLVYTQSRHLPSWAQGHPHVFFQAAETYERANGIAFEEWKIALPHELTHRQNMDLTRDLVQEIAGDQLPITYALHDPTTLDGQQQQPHLHLLISPRQGDGIERPPAQHFKRYNATHPERGGARKDPTMNHMGAVRGHRVLIADVINLHLERAGLEARVHPGTLKSQGIEREPEPKLLPSESRAYRDKGVVSATMQEVLDIRAQRQATRGEEQAAAREYWEARKVELGLTDVMDLPAQLTAIGTARALVRDQTPAQRVQETAGVAHEEQALVALAEEAVVQVQADAQTLWHGVQDLADAWQLRHGGLERVQEARTEAQTLWQDTTDAAQLREVGKEAADDAWRDAVLLWAEELGARTLRDVGWEAVQDARELGQEGLEAELGRQRVLAQAQGWGSLAQDLEALARQLEAMEEGGTGGVRVRLWDRERDQSWGF